MKEEIYHKEVITFSETVKQWVVSIVLLIDIIGLTFLYSYYNKGIIPNESFDTESMIAIPAIALFVSLLIVFIVNISGFSIYINENSISIKPKVGSAHNYIKQSIKEYHILNKKEYYKIIGGSRKKAKKLKKDVKQHFIGTPNYIINLHDGTKILLQIKRNSSFEYAMNKMLDKVL
jgi:hypothetical protein